MPFVKLDTGILESTLWVDRAARDVFITALLMAEPREISSPEPTYYPDRNEKTDFEIPPGWYGFVAAAGPGIIRRALVENAEGMAALGTLSSIDSESRSPEFGGRRMVRVDGGYIILNYIKYREKDHGAAERMRLYRAKKKGDALRRTRDAVTSPVTYADADAYADKNKTTEVLEGVTVEVLPTDTEVQTFDCSKVQLVPVADFREQASFAARCPLDKLDWTGREAMMTYEDQIVKQLQKPGNTKSAKQIAEWMVEQWRLYEVASSRIERPYGIANFFKSGIWAKPERWKAGNGISAGKPTISVSERTRLLREGEANTAN